MLRRICVSVLLAMVVALGGPVRAAEPIKIGDLNSYTRLPAFSLPYKSGGELALEEINQAGGVLGRPLQVISRDDGGKPGDAVTAANELVSREGVSVLIGTLLSHVGLAVSDFAKIIGTYLDESLFLLRQRFEQLLVQTADSDQVLTELFCRKTNS